MKKTLKIIYVTLLFLAVFALGEYFAAKNIFNLFEDRVISKNLQGTTTSKILMEEPSVDLISEETYLYEVYKGTNDANNEEDILTLYTNNKYVLSVKSNDRESIRIHPHRLKRTFSRFPSSFRNSPRHSNTCWLRQLHR